MENISLIKQPKDDISMQLKELLTNDMLITLFPKLHKLATICLPIPISTASAKRSFSEKKLINNPFVTPLLNLACPGVVTHFLYIPPPPPPPPPFFIYIVTKHIHYLYFKYESYWMLHSQVMESFVQSPHFNIIRKLAEILPDNR